MSPPRDPSPRLRDIDWRWALPRIALVFIVTRLLVLAVAVAVETTQPAPPDGIRADERPILASLTAWDGGAYLRIATDGYRPEFDEYPDYAFFPAFPIAARLVSVLTAGDHAIAAVLVANGAFGLALVALYGLSIRYLTPSRAILSLWFLALAPGAGAFGLAYSESLFLLAAVGAFLAAETRHAWAAGVALAIAAISRAPGILLVIPLLALYVERDGWRPTRSWLPLALAPTALALHLGFLWWLTGDALAPIHAQVYWDTIWNWSSTSSGLEHAVVVADVSAPIPEGLRLLSDVFHILLFGILAAYAFLFVYFRPDRMRPAYWLVALTAIVAVVLAGRPYSAPRYLALAWPFDWVLSNRRSVLGRGLVLTGFAAGQVVFLWLAFDWRLAP